MRSSVCAMTHTEPKLGVARRAQCARGARAPHARAHPVGRELVGRGGDLAHVADAPAETQGPGDQQPHVHLLDRLVDERADDVVKDDVAQDREALIEVKVRRADARGPCSTLGRLLLVRLGEEELDRGVVSDAPPVEHHSRVVARARPELLNMKEYVFTAHSAVDSLTQRPNTGLPKPGRMSSLTGLVKYLTKSPLISSEKGSCQEGSGSMIHESVCLSNLPPHRCTVSRSRLKAAIGVLGGKAESISPSCALIMMSVT